jgi:hypothetical protein
MTMETSRLKIGCAAIKYLVPARHPAPLRVRHRLDDVIERELPQTLARAFDSWLSDSDPSIWIIRQLHIEAAVNVVGEPEQITRTLTTQIVKNLAATFQDENSDNVRHFPSRAAYLASFLADLAFGTAKSQWYYQSLAGLNALPLSAALRTALCDDSRTGKAALRLLSAAELRRIVQSLSVQDARQVLEQIAAEGPVADQSLCHQSVVEAATAKAAALSDLSNEWQRALYLFIAAIDDAKASDGVSLRDAALKVARYKNGWPKAGAGSDASSQVYRRNTVFGEVFFILPELDQLPLLEATRDWPHADEAAAISLVRFLVLLKCCGSESSERAFYDPLVRDLLLIPLALSVEVFRTWQARLKPQHLESFLTALWKWQVARSAIQAKEQLLTVVTQRTASRLLVLIDAARGLWLWTDRDRSREPQKIIASLRAALRLLTEAEGALYSDPALVSLWRENFPQLNVVDLSDSVIDAGAAEKHGIDAIIARLDKLHDDWEFLRLPARLKIARPLDRILSIAAQHVLRGIAWRLPGFAASNLPYLARNFLEFGARVEEEPVRRVVRVGRPPLHLVLNMTGMTRQSYRLSWLDERPFELFQQDQPP